MLVLWNRGAEGLITDETSAPHGIMSLPQLTTALASAGAVDVIDFDMCLMGGYETLAAVQKYALAVVASEETEPGDGEDYSGMLKAMYAAPTGDAAALFASSAAPRPFVKQIPTLIILERQPRLRLRTSPRGIW